MNPVQMLNHLVATGSAIKAHSQKGESSFCPGNHRFIALRVLRQLPKRKSAERFNAEMNNALDFDTEKSRYCTSGKAIHPL
jgi:hypothetical protein